METTHTIDVEVQEQELTETGSHRFFGYRIPTIGGAAAKVIRSEDIHTGKLSDLLTVHTSRSDEPIRVTRNEGAGLSQFFTITIGELKLFVTAAQAYELSGKLSAMVMDDLVTQVGEQPDFDGE